MSVTVVEVDGADGVTRWLRSFDQRVDHWLLDLVGDAVEHAGHSLREHAPGGIKDLVIEDEPQDLGSRSIVGVAGVIPDVDEQTITGGLGSAPSDYPFYVDVGTGIYGEHGTPITAFPGHVMGPIEYNGRMIYIKSFKGQPAQDYSGAAARDTDAWLDVHITRSIPDLTKE